MNEALFPKAHFTTWDDIEKDSWFLIDRPDEIELPDDGEPFDTLDAKFTVYYGWDNDS